jgi:aspartate kinase
MRVLKFGGTSVGKPERMRQVADLVTKDEEAKIVVLSAVSGTTNALVTIGDSLYKKSKNNAEKLTNELYDSYLTFISTLYPNKDYLAKGKEVVDNQFSVIRNMIPNDFTDKEERLLLAQGELISTQLFTHFCHQEGIEAELIWALDFMSIDEYDEPELDIISVKLKEVVKNAKSKILVTQGYICMNHNNEVDNLKRGGSDYTASLVGAGIEATVVEIWTDIDGMHNNDPRVVDKTKPIAELSFSEAAELAYFGAKILHPSTIRPAQKKNIPVKLLNTMDPEAKGTTISKKTGKGDIKAVAAKDNITAIKIKSSRMLLAYGFLRKVFEVFEEYRTPIDMITTSEIAVSLTIDDDTHLKEIVKELEKFGHVAVDTDLTIVCVAGSFGTDKTGIIQKVTNALNDIPLRMVSYGGSKYNVSMLINTADKKRSLQALNDHCFEF